MTDYPAAPTPPSAPMPPPTPLAKKKRRLWIWIVGAVVLIIVIAAIASGGKKSDDTAGSPTTASSSASSAEPAPTTATPTTTKVAPTTTSSVKPTPTTTAAPAYQPIETKNYTGSGDDVITIEKPADKAALLAFSCPGCSSNVAVKTDSDLLVNEIGAYTGTHLIDIRNGEQTTTVEITADSDWTLDISDISLAPETGAGTGDSVIWVRTGTKVAVTHDGTSNFAINAASADNGIDLLVNEIGPYTGTVRIYPPTIMDITADGAWTITPS